MQAVVHSYWFVLVVLVVVFCHEMGHFLLARYFGAKVERFSIGFGPALLKYTDSKRTLWTLSLLPLGGFIKIKGEGLLNNGKDNEEDSFSSKKRYQKALIVAGGPFANVLLAVVIFFFMFYLLDPRFKSTTVEYIDVGSYMRSVGLNNNDTIISVDDKEVENLSELIRHVASANKNVIKLDIVRDGQQFELGLERNKLMFDGLKFVDMDVKFLNKLIYSIKASVSYSYLITREIVFGISELVSQKNFKDSIGGGPLRIANYSSRAAQDGVSAFAFFIAIFSLNLALINLLPIPGLDGGYLVIYAIEWITGSEIPIKAKKYLFRFGGTIILFLMVVAIFNDIKWLIS